MIQSTLRGTASCITLAAIAMCVATPAIAATIRGRVIDAARKVALPGATVAIGGATTTTDSDGSFTLDGVVDGQQVLTVDYVGYDEASQPIAAADTAAPIEIAMKPQGSSSEIVVTGTRFAEAQSLQTKKAANNFTETLYANDVGKLPDQNVAEAVRRLPGLSVANDQGEGRYVIIRGIDPSLINVTLNGQTLPAPEPDGRQVKLDDLPSALINSIVVTKSLTADQDANAIGGEVAIRTLGAFDRNKDFFLDARGSYGWYKLNGKDPYELDGQIGGLFGANHQFGAVISVNYSRRPIESENFQASENWADVMGSGFIVPDQAGLRDYNLVRTRLGIVGNFDWHPNDATKIYLRTSYSKFSDNEYRDQNIIALGTPITNQTATTGTFNGATSIKMRRRREDDNTKSAMLGGEFDTAAGGKLELSGSYARAIKSDPVRSEFTFNGPTVPVNYDLGTSPVYSFIPTGLPFDTPANFTFNKVNFDNRRAVEDLWQARADFTTPIGLGDGSTVKIGAKFLDRHKTNDENSLAYKKGGTKWTMDNVAYTADTGFYDDMFHYGERIDWDAARAFVNANPGVIKIDKAGSVADSLAGDYDVREQIIAGYAMATLKFGQLTLVPGVRVEHTRDRAEAKLVDAASDFTDGFNSFGSKSYTDWFPGLNARFDVSKDFVLRGAVTTAIGRPNYPDLAPYVTVEDDTIPNIALGNPDLKPYRALNVDLGAEYYLPGQGLLSIGLFYKHIDNPIYSQGALVINGTFGGQLYPAANVSQPVNVDSEIVKGIEFNAQKRFTFLPAPFDGFGLSLNYTHISGHGKGLNNRPGIFPLFDQSSNVGTAQLFYEKYGFTARVAYSYRSKYLDTLGGDAAGDEYTDGNGQLDVHVSYQVMKNVTIFADGTNLNDAAWRRFIGTKNQLIERERYDISLRGGVQVHF